MRGYLKGKCLDYVWKNFPERDVGDMREMTVPSGNSWVALNNSTNRLYIDMRIISFRVPKKE